jgi:serine/threonine protein phosphatase 1
MPRLLAIGDPHGCAAELDALLDRLAPTPDDHLVLMGDYVDRGPDARGVVERCLALEEEAASGGTPVTFLRGNHEAMMLKARKEGGHTLANWLYNGGGATLLSYGHPPGLKTRHHTADERPVDGWEQLVPEEHWAFIERTVLYLDHPAYLFVHAGADPDRPLAESVRARPERLMWERRHLADGADLSAWEKPVVCGHTKVDAPVDWPKLVMVDTGAYRPYLGDGEGALTAAVLPTEGDGARRFVSVRSRSV